MLTDANKIWQEPFILKEYYQTQAFGLWWIYTHAFDGHPDIVIKILWENMKYKFFEMRNVENIWNIHDADSAAVVTKILQLICEKTKSRAGDAA